VDLAIEAEHTDAVKLLKEGIARRFRAVRPWLVVNNDPSQNFRLNLSFDCGLRTPTLAGSAREERSVLRSGRRFSNKQLPKSRAVYLP